MADLMLSDRFPTRVLAVVVSAALLAAACGGGTTPAATTAPATPGATAAAATVTPTPAPSPEKELVFAGPAGALGDVFKALLKDFGAKHSIQTTYVEGNVANNFAKVQSQVAAKRPEIDVVLGSDAVDGIGQGQGIYAQIDLSLVPNSKNLAPGSIPDHRRGIIADVTVLALAYRTDVFKSKGWSPPAAWSDLWDAKYDCTVIQHPKGGGGNRSVAMMNLVAGGSYENIDATIAKLTPLKDKLTFVLSSPDVIQRLEQGSGCLGPSNESRAYISASNGAQIGVVIPKEGTTYETITANIVSGAPHPVAAHMWVDFWLGAEAQAKLMAAGNLSPTNAKVTAPASGTASKLVPASRFVELNVKPVTAETFVKLDEWSRKWDSAFAK